MKLIHTAIVAIMATSLIFVGITSSAYANPLDDIPGHAKLLPKSYGSKNTFKVCGDKLCFDKYIAKSFDGIKKEPVKNYKKIVEHYKALNTVRSA